jgi:hypothetical protein
LKKGRYHIVYSWLLLVCFVAGQYMVYSHQHTGRHFTGKTFGTAKTAPHQTVKEKCDLCDVMHHNAMLASYQVYLNPEAVAVQIYKSTDYSFTNIRLILAAGRAPPSQQS